MLPAIDKSGLNACGPASKIFLLLILAHMEGPRDRWPLAVDGSITVITHSFWGVRRKEIAFFVKVFSIQFSPISPVWLSFELLHQVTDEFIPPPPSPNGIKMDLV